MIYGYPGEFKMSKKACFFCRTKDKSIFDRNEFYKIDIQILQDLGYQVQIATSWKEIPMDADLYFVWWWTYALYPVLLAKIMKKKLIITGTFNLHGKVDGAGYYSRPFYQRMLIYWSAKLAPANLVVSRYEYERLRNLIKADNVFYSPHTLNIDEYGLNSKTNRKDYFFTIAWMSRLNSIRKCIPELIQAIRRLKDEGEHPKLLIAGKMENDAGFLRTMVKELQLEENVKFLGLISQEEKIQRLQECKIYLQPTRFEGFGVAIAEALLCGTPVITSDEGAVSEVTNGYCKYVDGTSPESIAKGIKNVLEHYTKYLEIAEKGKEHIKKNFTYSRRFQDIKALLEKEKQEIV
jgi:glycosyltransferase involved in cell wall biosynthesis